MDTHENNNRFNESARGAFLLLAFYLIAALFFVIFSDIRRIVTIVSDDCGYFLEIAENLAGGKGPTFDGLNVTNGYQPLWLYLLAAIDTFAAVSTETMLRICVSVQAILLFLSGLMFYRVHAQAFSVKTGLVSASAFIVFVSVPCLNGMESALLVFMLGLLVYSAWKLRIFSTGYDRHHLLFGILLGLTVLARLDAVFAGAALAVCLTVDMIRGGTGRNDKLKRLLLIGAGSAIVLAPYLFYNLASTGSVMPISGSLKSTFPRICTSGYGISRLSARDWGKLAAACLYILWYLLPRRKRASESREFFRSSVALLGFSVLLHFLHTALFMKWAVFRWHFVTYGVLGTFVLSEPVEYVLSRIPDRFVRTAWPSTLALILALTAFIFWRKIDRPQDWTVQCYDAAIWARNSTGPDDIFAMKDSGIFGYFSRRRTVNLDGVANNAAYQEVLKSGGLEEYLCALGVNYIAQHAIWNRDDVVAGDYSTFVQDYPSRKYDGTGDSLVLQRQDEAYRSPVYFDGAFNTVFLAWRFSCPPKH